MNTEMKMEKRKLSELRPADYNPRSGYESGDFLVIEDLQELLRGGDQCERER